MELSIIIVNYNVKYFLEQCLYSVLKSCKNIEAEILVVDNGSTDGSQEYLGKRFPAVHFLWNRDNPGFGKANNSALQLAKGNYILFLNPDTIIAEDTLEACLAFAKDKKEFGGLGIHMIDGAGVFLKESKRSFPSGRASLFRMTGLSRLFPLSKYFSGYYAGNLPEKESNKVDVLAGAFMLVKKKALDITGGFDEDFFMYGEDIDLSYRLLQAGFENYYFAGSTIIHFKGESTQRHTGDYIRHFYGAMELFVDKHVKDKKKAGMMRLGINAVRKIAKVKLILMRPATAVTNYDKPDATAVLASQKQFNEVIQIIKFAKRPLMIKGRIAADPAETESSLGKLNDVRRLAHKKAFNHLILCEGDTSFKEIISIVRQLKNKLYFLFHAAGSDSIVGSNKQDGPGLFIAKE